MKMENNYDPASIIYNENIKPQRKDSVQKKTNPNQ